MKGGALGWLTGGVALLLALALPHLLDPYQAQVATNVAVFAALAVSWDILARTGQLSLAHAGFFGLGGYAMDSRTSTGACRCPSVSDWRWWCAWW